MFEKFHRGDIYSADLSPGIGSEQSGSRPVLILISRLCDFILIRITKYGKTINHQGSTKFARPFFVLFS